MIVRRRALQPRGFKGGRRLAHLWAFFLPIYMLIAAGLDPSEVTNGEYLKFLVATGTAPPEHWVGGRYLAGQEHDPVVLVNFFEAEAYCRFVGRRLPTVDEWQSTCETGKLSKRGDIWEWTSTEIQMGGQVYKALCGPANACDCSHRYLPQWKNEVKGFRCSRDAAPLAWFHLLARRQSDLSVI